MFGNLPAPMKTNCSTEADVATICWQRTWSIKKALPAKKVCNTKVRKENNSDVQRTWTPSKEAIRITPIRFSKSASEISEKMHPTWGCSIIVSMIYHTKGFDERITLRPPNRFQFTFPKDFIRQVCNEFPRTSFWNARNSPLLMLHSPERALLRGIQNSEGWALLLELLLIISQMPWSSCIYGGWHVSSREKTSIHSYS